MTLNIKFFLLCPIPDEQKPMNEYIKLKENFLTSWILLKQRKYNQRVFLFYTFLFFISTFFLFVLNLNISSAKFFLLDSFLANFFLLFLYLVNFIRWKEMKNRFTNSRIFYEEGSWYDGQMWEKPFFLIKNDTLLMTQKIQPIIQRIRVSMVRLFYLNIFLLLIYFH